MCVSVTFSIICNILISLKPNFIVVLTFISLLHLCYFSLVFPDGLWGYFLMLNRY